MYVANKSDIQGHEKAKRQATANANSSKVPWIVFTDVFGNWHCERQAIGSKEGITDVIQPEEDEDDEEEDEDEDEEEESEHEHQWGPIQTARFTGTEYRKCQTCGELTLDLCDEDMEGIDDPIYEDEAGCEFLRTWQEGDFRLMIWDTNRKHRDGYPQIAIAYKFFHKDVLIFKGADFGCSPMHAVDSDQCIAGILTFLSLRPGDVDAEYFKDYSIQQMAFAEAHGEELSLYAIELEERAERERQADEDEQAAEDDPEGQIHVNPDLPN